RKTVKFDNFKMYYRKYNEEEQKSEELPCDLSDVFTHLKNIPTSERIYRIGGDEARLQGLNFENDKWELHFVRIRKNGFPIITHDDGSYTYMDELEDEQGLAEEVSAIYDPENFVIMIRRNMNSLAPSAISNYITNVINTQGYTVIFNPLIHPMAKSLLKKEHLIRGAEVKIGDIKSARNRTKMSLGRMVNDVDNIEETVSMYLKIGIQNKGSKKNSKLPLYDELEELIEDPEVESVKVRRKADEDAKVEHIDLIKHRLVDYHTFTKDDFHKKSRN